MPCFLHGRWCLGGSGIQSCRRVSSLSYSRIGQRKRMRKLQWHRAGLVVAVRRIWSPLNATFCRASSKSWVLLFQEGAAVHETSLVRTLGLDLSPYIACRMGRGLVRRAILRAGIHRGGSSFTLGERHPVWDFSLCRATPHALELDRIEVQCGRTSIAA